MLRAHPTVDTLPTVTAQPPEAPSNGGTPLSEQLVDPAADPMGDSDYRLAVVDLLGALAYGELTAFERLADDASFAPSIADKAALAAMAVAEYNHFSQIRTRLEEMGTPPEEAMEPFMPALEAFHERTAPRDWLEGLVKAYVGDGIATDFYREISAYLDDSTRDLVLRVLEDTGHSAFAVDRVRAAIEADSPSDAIRRVWFSVRRANIRPTSARSAPRCDIPPTRRAASASRSAATRWAWLSASPTSRRPHRASRPASRGSASMAARTRSTAKAE